MANLNLKESTFLYTLRYTGCIKKTQPSESAVDVLSRNLPIIIYNPHSRKYCSSSRDAAIIMQEIMNNSKYNVHTIPSFGELIF